MGDQLQGSTQAPMAAPIQGWYADPYGQGLRWWDGAAWTGNVQPAAPPVAPPAPAPPVATAAAPAAQYSSGPDLTPYTGSFTSTPTLPVTSSAPEDRQKVFLGIGIVVAVAAALFFIFVVMGGEDEPTLKDAVEQGRSDRQAMADARTVQTALETYVMDHNGSYASATQEGLAKVESSVAQMDFALTPEKSRYVIAVTSEGGTTFTITREADGSMTTVCDQPATGGCGPSGTW